MSASRRSPFVWLVVLLCAVYVACLAFTIHAVATHYGEVKDPGWLLRASGDGWFVSQVDADGPAAGTVEVGDRLVALNGDERAAVIGASQFRNVDGGASYRVDFERRGQRLSLELPLRIVRGRLLEPLFLIVSVAFLVCGAGLALLRPGDPQVRLIGLLMIVVAFDSLVAALSPPRPFLNGWQRVVYYALVVSNVGLLAMPMAFHLFNRFPDWTVPGRPWRIAQWLLYAIGIVVMWPAGAIADLGLAVFQPATSFLAAHPRLYLTSVLTSSSAGKGSFFYMGVCLLLALAASARNYRRLNSEGSRRRVRWVLTGLTVALIPFIVLSLARATESISLTTYHFYMPITFLAMLFIPAAIVMAVWKEQLFDIRVLVRRGLQYLFARAALRTLFALPVLLLAFSILSNPNRTVAQILTQGSGWINVALIGTIAIALQSRQKLQASLDRRFFREAYEQEQVLSRLIDEVRQRESLSEVATLVGARVDSVLHPASLHIFYRAQERSDRFDGHSSSGAVSGLQLSTQPALLRLLETDDAIRDVPAGIERLPPDEREWLMNLGVRLIVPIAGTRDRLVGVLLLGERKSEEPYSATDRRLLQGIAAQIGLVYENQHLKERVRRDADVRRDVLARLDEGGLSLLKECPACGRCYDSVSERCDTDCAELALTMPIERTLEGKYRLDRAIGRGGFGAVYEASDLRLQRPVAAKVMMGSLFGDQTALRRFEREARAAAKIDHPHITRVHDYGTVGSGGAFLIMELVSGNTWRAELQRAGAVAPSRAAEWFRQLLDGLQFAHGMGIVHRDLKPENVMIVSPKPEGMLRAEADQRAETVKIMDFGLAKVRDAGAGATESVTVAGTALGTIGYMAPEALTGGLVDERTDLFAIGVMVVETVTGARPFTGATPEQVLTALLRNDYHLPGASPEMRTLDTIVQRCVAKDPRDRYVSASELARELVPALARCGGIASGAAQEGAQPVAFDGSTVVTKTRN
jgi:GAF domain-containing protein/tRNA A-37 threonylcarbamoyl transferase component Bud32